MTRSVGEATRDISAVRGMVTGKAQSAAALAQLRRVETEGPQEVKAYALHALIEAYWFGGDEEKAFVPFSQEVAWYDKHPEWFDEADRYNLFWSFKWMVGGLRGFPSVSLDQLWATLEDMERRYGIEGFSMDAPYQQRWQLAAHIGADNTSQLYEQWLRQPRDDMSNCDLCAAGDRAEFAFFEKHIDDGLALVEATLNDPTIRKECFSEPAAMYAAAQFAYLKRGEPGDEARAVWAHRMCRGYWDESYAFGSASRDMQLLRERAFSLGQVRSQCIEFLARTRNTEAAIRLLLDNKRFLTQADSPLAHLHFLSGVGAGLRVIVEELGQPQLALDLSDPPTKTAEQLLAWVKDKASQLAKDFDARNGNDYQSRMLAEHWQVTAFPSQIDLSLLGEAAVDADDQSAASEPESPARQPESTEAPVPQPTESSQVAPASPSELVRLGDGQASRGQAAEAIASYLKAAAGFEQQGQLSQAGFARAEAGHLALQADDLASADQCLRRAVKLLRAALTPSQFLTPVMIALAQCLSRQGNFADAEQVLLEATKLVDTALDQPIPEDIAPDVRKAYSDDMAWASASLAYQRARLLAQVGNPIAPAVAQHCAEAMAELGLAAQAAEAFQFAGVTWQGQDDEKAIWCLESAVEGFRIALRRPEKTQAANLLVDLLQKLGRTDEATAAAVDL